ncbi:MAG: hypothetical protein KDK59_00120 [Simkania sp.]|nr:hypothetical protein [Simkania sp.]
MPSSSALIGLYQFLSQIDATQLQTSKFHNDFNDFTLTYHVMTAHPSNFNDADRSTISNHLSKLGADNPIVSLTQLNQIIHNSLESVQSELNSGQQLQFEQAVGALYAISLLIFDGPWSQEIKDQAINTTFHIASAPEFSIPVAQLLQDVSWLLDQPDFKTK